MHEWIETVYQLNQNEEAYVLVTILNAQGSTPRESGTKMVVSRTRTYGTIGGGNLEFQAINMANDMLQKGQARQHWETFSLGPSLGQCCGGRITVLFECFPGNDFHIMLFGAGHVGTALVDILKQVPCRLHWVDARENQHANLATLPDQVIATVNEAPEDEIRTMPGGGYYIIATHNHQMDLTILETILKRRDARYVGLIGSPTKWKRFTSRLGHKGYDPMFYQHVRCPIGLPTIKGKHPMEVAVSVAAEVLEVRHSTKHNPPRKSEPSLQAFNDGKIQTAPVHNNGSHAPSHA